jgi:hypothetical protein
MPETMGYKVHSNKHGFFVWIARNGQWARGAFRGPAEPGCGARGERGYDGETA